MSDIVKAIFKTGTRGIGDSGNWGLGDSRTGGISELYIYGRLTPAQKV